MKKVKDWYQELPKDIRKKAFANTSADRLERMSVSLENAVAGSFVFHETPEGERYWGDIVYSK